MLNVNDWITKLATVLNLGSPVVTDGRRHRRIQTDFAVYLSGPVGYTSARCTDLNHRGMGLLVTAPADVGTLLFLHITEYRLIGFAHVRHCRSTDGGYILGLEFRGKLSREKRAVEAD